MFSTFKFRIPPAVGGVLGIALIAIGITSGMVSLAIGGAVVVAAASVRFLVRR